MYVITGCEVILGNSRNNATKLPGISQKGSETRSKLHIDFVFCLQIQYAKNIFSELCIPIFQLGSI